MGNNTASTDATRVTDRRQRENENPDRPPIDPSDPDSPDPFDPFETAHIADGGVIVQDPTEQTFETQLDAVLPSTDTPVSPSPEHTQPDRSTTEHTTSAHTATVETETPPAVQTEPSEATFNPKPPESGTLLADVETFLTSLEPTWSYEIQAAESNDDVDHHAVTDGTAVFSLRKIIDGFYVYHNTGQPRYRNDSEPNEYNAFGTAMAAFIEGIDWGTLPPGNGDPQIWTYTGYSGVSDTFQTYLSGKNNNECGDHYFANESADYGIHIASYRDERPEATPGQTMCLVTLTDQSTIGDGTPIYRGRFPGQKHAFDFLLTALDEGLSSEIAMHDGERGDSAHVPPIELLTTRP